MEGSEAPLVRIDKAIILQSCTSKSEAVTTGGGPVRRGLVGAAGIEPATLCLEGRCSIQLSYAPALSLTHY